MVDAWAEGIDCFEDFDYERCIDCVRKDECLFYQPVEEIENI